MAQTQRKPVYVLPAHHEILRRIAYEQRCNLSDVLDVVLENTDWEAIAKNAKQKPLQRATERGSSYKV
jgi:fatty acid desaturase